MQPQLQQGFLNRHSGVIGTTGAVLGAQSLMNGMINKNYTRALNKDILDNKQYANKLSHDVDSNSRGISDNNTDISTNTNDIITNGININKLYGNDTRIAGILKDHQDEIQDRAYTIPAAFNKAGDIIKDNVNQATAPGTPSDGVIQQIAQGLGLNENTIYKIEVLEENFKAFCR